MTKRGLLKDVEGRAPSQACVAVYFFIKFVGLNWCTRLPSALKDGREFVLSP